MVDTLIAETNAGSVRWMHGLAEMPLSPIKVREGDLSEYLLPLRGFSVDELKYKQEEKQLLQEKREKEELERLRREEQEQLVRSAADKMVPALFNANGNMMKSQLATSKIVFHNTGDRLRIPGLLRESSFQTAEMVTEAMYSQNSNATSLQVALIPKGTSPALSYMKAPTKLVIPTRESDMLQEETIPPYNSDMCDISVAVDVDCVEEGHICVDEPVTVFDCKNSAVSQDVTDDAALELETKPDPGDIDDANENQYPKLISEIVDSLDIDTSFTLEDYERQVKETLQAEKAELLETQAILNAPPAAEAIDVLQRGMDPKMNTTGTISDAGSDLVPSAEIVRNSTETSEIIVEDLFPESLSLIPDLDIIPSDRPAIVTVADLEKQVQEILEAEKAEMLETQAILNAPPAADGIEVLEEENKDSLLRSLNATNSESDLAILEMDAPDVPPDHSLSIYDESSVDNSDVGDYKIEVGVMCGANMGASEENDINWSINSVNGEKSVDGDGE